LVVGRDDRGLLRFAVQRPHQQAGAVRPALQLPRAYQPRRWDRFQNKRRPSEFNYQAMGAYRLATAASNQARWDGEIPVADKSQYRDQAVVDAFNAAALATDPTSGTRSPPSLRAPNGVLEDSFLQATGRPLWSASSIYVPVLVIAGEFDTWSYPEDREGLMRDLTNAPAKRSVTIKNATHFVLFEKPRFEFFEAIDGFLKE
jgi:pimeloyl-ACP methyl ester carboxylesterase